MPKSPNGITARNTASNGWNFDPLTQPSFRPSGATKRLGPGPTATALDPSLSSVSASTSTGSRLDRSGALTSTNRDHDRSATPAHEAHAVAASRKPNVTMGSVILDLAALKKRIGELEELDKERQSELAKVKERQRRIVLVLRWPSLP